MTTTIRVELVLSIEVDSAWGEDCTVKQIYKQGVDSAIAKVERALKDYRGVRIVSVKDVEMTTRVS